MARAMQDQIQRWREQSDWSKIKCLELLQVRGMANKDVAVKLGLTEQQVANFKFDFLARLKKAVRGQGLNRDVFPELYADQ